jgi:hypothetical protein
VRSPFDGYEVEPQLRPQAARYDFDLDAVLDSVVALEAQVPADAFTAASLGAHRIGERSPPVRQVTQELKSGDTYNFGTQSCVAARRAAKAYVSLVTLKVFDVIL